jgi:hypothetical protein
MRDNRIEGLRFERGMLARAKKFAAVFRGRRIDSGLLQLGETSEYTDTVSRGRM